MQASEVALSKAGVTAGGFDRLGSTFSDQSKTSVAESTVSEKVQSVHGSPELFGRTASFESIQEVVSMRASFEMGNEDSAGGWSKDEVS